MKGKKIDALVASVSRKSKETRLRGKARSGGGALLSLRLVLGVCELEISSGIGLSAPRDSFPERPEGRRLLPFLLAFHTPGVLIAFSSSATGRCSFNIPNAPDAACSKPPECPNRTWIRLFCPAKRDIRGFSFRANEKHKKTKNAQTKQ